MNIKDFNIEELEQLEFNMWVNALERDQEFQNYANSYPSLYLSKENISKNCQKT